MTRRRIVVALFTTPETVLQDYRRLFELAGGPDALPRWNTTILKDNITWHFRMPGANTTPWQLEGSILALRAAGYQELECVQNQTVVTNAFGGLLSKYRHCTHTWIHETLVDLLTIQREVHPGIFAFMDGTTAGNGGGPRMMQPAAKNLILASADQVAIDAVAAKLMGFDPLSIRYIRLAHEAGLGIGNPREIEIVGDDVTGENWSFHVGHSTHSFLAWLSWYGPTKALQKFLFRTPLVVLPTLIGEIEQDYLFWPLKYRAVARRWRESTEWGRLFERCQQRKQRMQGEAPDDRPLEPETAR